MMANRLPEDPEKRRRIQEHGLAWLVAMQQRDPRHAALYCPEHVNYIGARGIFPCQDCT